MTAHCRITSARRDEDEDEDADIGAEWPHNFLRIFLTFRRGFWAVSAYFAGGANRIEGVIGSPSIRPDD
jgi:hypothetical protein